MRPSDWALKKHNITPKPTDILSGDGDDYDR